MAAPYSEPAEAKLYDIRRRRLQHLLATNAPEVIIANECLLLAQAWYGGELQLSWWLLCDHVSWHIRNVYGILRRWRWRRKNPGKTEEDYYTDMSKKP